jgi:peptidoglycan hydrolase-like protein with peptidoglycan-binding domain
LKLHHIILISFFAAFICSYAATTTADKIINNTQIHDNQANLALATGLNHHDISHIRQRTEKSDTQRIQARLKKLGYDCGAVDGVIGPQTEKAIKAFQKDNKLRIDGVVGPITAKALNLKI